MVATRRGAKLAAEAAAAPATTSIPPAHVFSAANNTLNAPPKRGGRKKAEVAQAAEPTPAVPKPKATTNKRKATADPGAAAKPAPTKRVTKPKATRAAKPNTYPELAPPPAKRAASGRKAREAFPEAATQVTATRSRRGAAVAAKTDIDTPMKDVEEEEPDLDLEDAPKPSRARKAATVKKPTTNGVQKPASRARKAQAPQDVAASVPAELPAYVPEPKWVISPEIIARARSGQIFGSPRPATRVTRSRNTADPPPESPLKAPARKPTKNSPLKAPARKLTKKAAAAVQKANALEPVEDPFAQYPTYPTTPAHIAAPLSTRQAMKELPQYPNTPAHIVAPISSKNALAELPGYPKTPAHIAAPITTKAALAALPGYPKTPAHVKAPISVQDAMKELPGYPKTPAHISAPLARKKDDLKMNDPKTSIHEMSDHERKMIQRKKDDFIIDDHMFPGDTTDEDDDDMDETPEPAQTPAQPLKAGSLAQDPSAEVSTPYQTTPPVMREAYEATGTAGTPAQINWGMTNQEAFQELPAAYPKTPAHITALAITEAAPAELPSSLNTPALVTDTLVETQPTSSAMKHHSSPVKTPTLATDTVVETQTASSAKKDPSSPAKTPALVRNTSLWARLTASARKYRSSPPKTPAMALSTAFQARAAASARPYRSSPPDMSFQTPEDTEYSELDSMEIDSEGPAAESTPNPHLLVNPYAVDLVSSKKSSLRSPDKSSGSSPKKAVTWVERDDADLLWDGPIKGTTFYVDIKCAENQPDYLFAELLEDLGARVVKEWDEAPLTHVLYKDGSTSTLEKVIASNGEIKCVSTGWVLECEAQRMHVDEGPFLVDLSARLESSPLRAGVSKTPARTPSKYALAPGSAKSYPTTPTSSEWDRSFLPEGEDEKENSEIGVFWTKAWDEAEERMREEQLVRTAPQKKTSCLLSRSPIKTPSKAGVLGGSPVRQMSGGSASSKKRSAEEASLPSLAPLGPPKKFRLSK